MKGVILAGGLGTRLYPLTKVTNKHLLQVYDRPMIYYPIQAMIDVGITDILLVTGGQNAGDFLRLLGNGTAFGLQHLNYAYQEGEGGIAAALRLAEFFVGDDSVCVMLGDNLFEKDILVPMKAFERQRKGAKIILKEVSDPQRFGVAVLQGDRVIAIEEKPAQPRSPYAVTGIYFYDKDVFRIIRTLRPSTRGELEITDVNNIYIQRSQMTWHIMDGWWTDAGTFDSLLQAGQLVSQSQHPTEATADTLERLWHEAPRRDNTKKRGVAGRAGEMRPDVRHGRSETLNRDLHAER